MWNKIIEKKIEKSYLRNNVGIFLFNFVLKIEHKISLEPIFPITFFEMFNINSTFGFFNVKFAV